MNNTHSCRYLDHASHPGLLSMLGVAAILHILALCLFKVVVITPGQISPVSSATFYVLHAGLPDSAPFYRWLEAEDASLFTKTTPAAQENIHFPNIPYVPSYEITIKNRQPHPAAPLP